MSLRDRRYSITVYLRHYKQLWHILPCDIVQIEHHTLINNSAGKISYNNFPNNQKVPENR